MNSAVVTAFPDFQTCFQPAAEPGELEIAPVTRHDIGAFLGIYARNDSPLVCDGWEIEFLLGVFPQGCFVCRDAGVPVAFVTSIAYGKSGWIGNLIVAKAWRGRGIGTRLTACAIDALNAAGVGSIWLASTEAGKGIYRGSGFVAVDEIHTWVGSGRAGTPCGSAGMDVDRMASLDRSHWGERRDVLLEAVCRRGTVTAREDAFLVSRRWNYGFSQLGPWSGGSIDCRSQGELLESALVRIGAGRRVFCYVPSGNRTAAALFPAHGFVRSLSGSFTLMCLGGEATYNPGEIFGLASPALG